MARDGSWGARGGRPEVAAGDPVRGTQKSPFGNLPGSIWELFFDPFGNAAHTSLSYEMVGEDVLITGAGPIGLMSVAICNFVGARNVVITDVNEYRLNLAKKMGATKTINVLNNSIHEYYSELGMTSGFDVGLEMSGNPEAFSTMLEHMYHGGKIALLGLLPNSTMINWDKFFLFIIKKRDKITLQTVQVCDG